MALDTETKKQSKLSLGFGLGSFIPFVVLALAVVFYFLP